MKRYLIEAAALRHFQHLIESKFMSGEDPSGARDRRSRSFAGLINETHKRMAVQARVGYYKTMKLKAYVVRVTGKTIHSIGEVIEGKVVPKQKMPDAAYVVTEEMNGSCYLYRYSNTGEFAGDTWHETLEEAKRQARFEYVIGDSDWFNEGE